MQRTDTFFHELTFDQLTQLADSRYNLQINPTTNSTALKSLSNQLNEFKDLLKQYYYDPNGFDASSFFQLDSFLVFNFLRLSHEYYLDKKIPEIEQYINFIQKNNNSSEARVLALLFKDYTSHLTEHIAMEEHTVFPLIRQIIESRDQDKLLCRSAQLKSQLVSFYIDHSDTEKDLSHMKLLVKEMCNTERGVPSILTNQLELFEADLKLHHILEEKILVPSVLHIIF